MTEDGEHPPGARLIGGRYRLAGRLGSGPTGTVWRALDEAGQGQVALKEPLLPGDPADDEESRRIAHRLSTEARAAARVRHPCAVTVLDVVTEGHVPWIVMELVEGESLREVLRRGPLPPVEAVRIGLAVLGALRAAHAVGIVHRDVKPANVLLESGTGRVVVTDFGTGGGHPGEAPAGFVAPERAAGPGAGPASDLWSLGALLRAAVGEEVEAHEAFGAHRAFGAHGAFGSSEVTGAGEATDVTEAREVTEGTGPVWPGALGPLLERLRADEPAARPDAAEVAAALHDYLGLTPVPEPVPPAAAREPEAVRQGQAAPVGPRRRTPRTTLGLLLAKKAGLE
ncbi:serine/threonine-protein kinase [Streptomyces monashensis]|uniref:non-specific serine/threonine protein kinase n=1 Tax=Streptomyces monashensis TaxID=1678012 RepID=A0A1S2QGZ9_9ACTN|nr:serine/threonine-protein kinase [Streptomyces monashensis]OIK04927.1 serine/threonine protein kinase [Streptomyces monashensis]